MDNNFDSIFGNEVEETVEDIDADIIDNQIEDTDEVAADETIISNETSEVETKDERNDHIPIAALLDTRDKLKDAQRELAEFRQREADRQAVQAQKQNVAPDPYDDPDGFRSYIAQEVENRLTAQKIELSLMSAKEKHGDDVTQAAINWAREKASIDPAFDSQTVSQPSPIEWVIQQHKRHTELAEFETDREAFIRREAAKLGIVAAATNVAQAANLTTSNGIRNTAPKSLANVTSGTKINHQPNDTEDFNSIFDKKHR